MTLREKQNEFVELFNSLVSWQEKFQYLIEIGEELPDMPEHLRSQANRIACASRIFFYPSAPAGMISIQGWSNAAIPSGLIAFIRQICEGSTVDELRDTEIDFHIRTDLINNMTEQRKEALLEMICRLRRV